MPATSSTAAVSRAVCKTSTYGFQTEVPEVWKSTVDLNVEMLSQNSQMVDATMVKPWLRQIDLSSCETVNEVQRTPIHLSSPRSAARRVAPRA